MLTKIKDYLNAFGIILSQIAFFIIMVMFAMAAMSGFMLWLFVYEVKERFQKFRNNYGF